MSEAPDRLPDGPEDLSGAAPDPDPQPDAPAPDIDPGAEGATVPWRALLAETVAILADAGVETAEVDARRIVEEATGHDGPALHPHLDDPATVGGVAALDRMVERRLAGEPLQYVLGRWAFRTLDLMVDRRVLIPRPETEGLVDHVLGELGRRREAGADPSAVAPVVVDLGCGSGAIGLAVAAEWRGAEVHLVDVAPEAVAVARANLAGLGLAGRDVTVHEGSWFAPLPPDRAGRVDVVVSNPPYVAADEALPPVVVDWEPAGALVAGPTGLEAVEAITTEAADWLVPGGLLVVEIGSTQGAEAAAAASAAGLVDVAVRPDLAGHDRVLLARSPA